MKRRRIVFVAFIPTILVAACNNCGMTPVQSAGDLRIGVPNLAPFSELKLVGCPGELDAPYDKPPASPEECFRSGNFNYARYNGQDTFTVYVRDGRVSKIYRLGKVCIDT